ncbi:hypothetical protein EON77_16435, partial [bacterium]
MIEPKSFASRARSTTSALIVFAVAVASGGGSMGCQKLREKVVEKATEKAAEKELEKQTGQKVDIQKTDEGAQTLKLEGAQGTTNLAVGETVKLPEGFPKEIPVYPGAKLTAAMSNDKDGKKAHVLVFDTPDKIDVVTTYYKANLKGFQPAVDMN